MQTNPAVEQNKNIKALRAKIDRKSAISLQRGHFNPKFQVEGVGKALDVIVIVAFCFRLTSVS